MPMFMLIFGQMIDSIGSSTGEGESGFSSMKSQSVMMLYVAFGVFIVSSLQMALFAVFAENIAHRIKIMYFRRVLEKDATWFDSNNPSEMSSRIANECSVI